MHIHLEAFVCVGVCVYAYLAYCKFCSISN